MQDRKDWLEWRRSGIGASDAPVVAGVSPFSSRLELFLDKKGRLPERPASQAMEWGLRLEPAIAQAYAERTGESFSGEQLALRSERFPFMLATLDRRTTDGKIVELKAAGLWAARDLGEDGDAESLPDHWVVQAHHQMEVAEADSVTFAVLVPTLELRVYEVRRNPTIAAGLVMMESEFWSMVERDEPPADVEASDASLLAGYYGESGSFVSLGQQEAEAAREYQDLGVQVRELERRREAARARLLLSMGDSSLGLLPDGREIHRKVIEIGESVVKARRQVRLSIKESR